MATVKNTSGDYTLTVAGGTGTFTINADLDVIGNITYIDSTELKVTDPFITVAAQNNGAIQSMGLVAQKTTTTWAGLRFNTVSGDWEISPAVDAEGGPITAYSTISTSGTPGAPDQSVQFNSSGTFAGSSALTFDAANAKLTLTGYQVFANTAQPPVVSNAVTLHGNIVGSGGTALYFKADANTYGELCSKTKAIVFGIIF
jgi:hypothetical protein